MKRDPENRQFSHGVRNPALSGALAGICQGKHVNPALAAHGGSFRLGASWRCQAIGTKTLCRAGGTRSGSLPARRSSSRAGRRNR